MLGTSGRLRATIVVRWPAGRSVLRGRSACDGCGRPLGAGELVPLLGWAMGRGRCRSCRAAIDPRHPAFEIGCAVIGALSAWVAPGLAGVFGALFGWLLLTLAALDAAVGCPIRWCWRSRCSGWRVHRSRRRS
ncbi:prepilin peptidase [Sphingomonas sp. MMS24-JH45]